MKRGLLLAALALAAGIAGCASTGYYGDGPYTYYRQYPSETRYYYYRDGRSYYRYYGDERAYPRYYGPDYRDHPYGVPGPNPRDYSPFKDHG